jgi:hypothetical protein
MTENKQQRPGLIGAFSAFFAAAADSCAQEMDASNLPARVSHTTRQKPPIAELGAGRRKFCTA